MFLFTAKKRKLLAILAIQEKNANLKKKNQLKILEQVIFLLSFCQFI